jgi:hypothetical protein
VTLERICDRTFTVQPEAVSMVTVFWGTTPCTFEHTSPTAVLQLIQVNELRIQGQGFQEVDSPTFQDHRHMKVVRLLAYKPAAFTPPPHPHEIFLVLISVRG